jgi:hypothetical protein
MAEKVVLTSPTNPVEAGGLIITQLPTPFGVRVRLAETAAPVLHVGSQGQIYTYKSGLWERRLLRLVAQSPLPEAPIHVTVTVPPRTLRAAIRQARTSQGHDHDPLALVGRACVQAAMALRYPPMP